MNTAWIDERISYDGAALRAHWILRRTGLVGDALVAFRGSCRVLRDEIADLEDIDGPGIAGDDMLHFVWERFDDASLETGILRQRLLAATVGELLRDRAVVVDRDGDDLYVAERKLSISIATRSPVSTLIHFAVNVHASGTPVPAVGIAEFGIDPELLARAVLAAIAAEETSITRARAKVRPKGESETP